MKGRSYSADDIPFVLDVGAYSKSWILWWTACQPAWRKSTGWPLSREKDTNADWGKLAARGQNGMFMVVMSTTWWATSLESAEDRYLFDEAVDDIRWVIMQVLESLPAPSTPEVPHDIPPPPETCKSIPAAASWFVRPEGKRQSKLTRKLLGG